MKSSYQPALEIGNTSRFFLTLMSATFLSAFSVSPSIAAPCTSNADPGVSCENFLVSGSGLTITVPTPVTITLDTSNNGTYTAVKNTGANTVLSNNGSLNGGNYGFYNDNIVQTLTNNGTITSTDKALYNYYSATIQNVVNNGTINGSNYGSYNRSIIQNFTNNGTLLGGGQALYNTGSTTLDHFTNNGTVRGGDRGIHTGSQMLTLTNNSSISGGNYGVYNTAVGSIQTFKNTGTISGDTKSGIQNLGTIQTLINGGTIDKYGGNLPTNYSILIGSPSNYGKMSGYTVGGEAATGTMTFGIETGSVVSAGTYTSVLTDLTASNLSGTSGMFGQYSWSLLDVGGNIWNLVLTGGSTIADSIAAVSNATNRGAAIALDTIFSSTPSGDMANIQNAFASLGSDQEKSNGVTQTLPILVGGSTQAVMQVQQATANIIQARQEANIGLSSGSDFLTERHFWFKPFGTWANQDTQNGVKGYDADTFGMMAGADSVVSENWRLGAAFAYANSNVNSDDGRNGLDIDSYQATLYSSRSLDSRTELNFQTAFGYNSNDSSRRINFGGLDRVAEGSFDSYSFTAGSGIGRRFDLSDSTTLTPLARFDYSLIRNNSYSETGAGGLNLDVNSQTKDQLISTVAVKLNHVMSQGFSINGNTGVGYDVLNDQNAVTSTYVGGGPAFTTNGVEPSPWIVNSGLGLMYNLNDDWDVSVRYDREDRGSALTTQTASIKVRSYF